jgi:hypothetical protein
MRRAAIWIMVVATVLAMQIRKEMAGMRKKDGVPASHAE